MFPLPLECGRVCVYGLVTISHFPVLSVTPIPRASSFKAWSSRTDHSKTWLRLVYIYVKRPVLFAIMGEKDY